MIVAQRTVESQNFKAREVTGTGESGKTAGMQLLGPSGIKGGDFDITKAHTQDAVRWQGWGTALKPAHEPTILARKPLGGSTVAVNTLTWGTGGLNIDKTRIGMSDADRKAALVPMVNAEGGMWNKLGSGREGRNGPAKLALQKV